MFLLKTRNIIFIWHSNALFLTKQYPSMAALKIVLLTDFSPLSKVAIQFAMKMSAKLDIEYTILNGVRLDGVPKSNLRWKQIEESLITVAEEEGAKLVTELKQKVKAPITFKAISAHTIADMVTRYVEKNYPTW